MRDKPKTEIWYHGTKEKFIGPLKPLYLTPAKALAKIHGTPHAFSINPDAKWLDIDQVEYYMPSIDSIGYSADWSEKLKNKGWDVIWVALILKEDTNKFMF